MKLDKNQRRELGKALYDVGKLVLVGLVIGQLVSKAINLFTFILGIAIFIACFWIATYFNKEE